MFSERECRVIMMPIFDALIYCHKMGIVHRDIKPENLLMSTADLSTGVIKISDFGLAKYLPGGQFANTGCGTIGYTAPEILSEIPYKGEPVDFWSCGIVLYFLLSGEAPFVHDDEFELVELIKKCEVSFNTLRWQQISPSAKNLVQRLLTPNQSERTTA